MRSAAPAALRGPDPARASTRPIKAGDTQDHDRADARRELGIDIADITVVAGWLSADEILDDAVLDDDALEVELRSILDPAGQRTARDRPACPECGRLPRPHLVLWGWQPCRCGGHATTCCTTDTGGCGHTRYEPEPDPQRCVDPGLGLSR